MPYVPSKKTPGHMKKYKEDDREVLQPFIIRLAVVLSDRIKENSDLVPVYKYAFLEIAEVLARLATGVTSKKYVGDTPEEALAGAIWKVAEKYNYDGAYLGELNYSITRLIQEVPKVKVAEGKYGSELRYWLYARTVEALTMAAYKTVEYEEGISGVYEDIKDEYKRRVNPAYEIIQIKKSGDCYDTPYHSQPVAVENEEGKLIGYVEVHLEHKDYNGKDIGGPFVLKRKK